MLKQQMLLGIYFLWLGTRHDGYHQTCLGQFTCVGCFYGTGLHQPKVVRNLPLWTPGMVMALRYLPEVAAYEEVILVRIAKAT